MAISETTLLKRRVSAYRAELDAFLAGKTEYPLLDRSNKAKKLVDAATSHPDLGPIYGTGLYHDFGNIDTLTTFSGRLGRVLNEDVLRACALGKRHIALSVLAEFGFKPQRVDLAAVIGEQRDFFDAYVGEGRLRPGSAPPIIVASMLPRGVHIISGQEDLTYRILLNASGNSVKSIRLRQDDMPGSIVFGCESAGDRKRLDVLDNGIGFEHIFKDIMFDSNEEVIPLGDLLSFSNSRSGFARAGIEGTGSGLGIMNHLGSLVGAEVFIANPRFIEGSRVSINFPAVA